MNYNIHPIIVHFPIALLFIYSLIKILPLQKWLPKTSWRQVGVVFLVLGVLGAWAGNATGEIAEHVVRVNREVLHAHTFFAGATNLFYVLLLLGELLPFITPIVFEKFNFMQIGKLFAFVQIIVSNKVLMVIFAILGLVSITFTGLLGGVMVYGTTADPLAGFVLQMLGISI